jgi:hypothetical protein
MAASTWPAKAASAAVQKGPKRRFVASALFRCLIHAAKAPDSDGLWADNVLRPHCPLQRRAPQLAHGLLDMPNADEAPAAQRFATPDGAIRFVFERSGRGALARFEGGEEVYALRPVPGPRGDEFFKTDTGQILLRITALGGVIVFAGAGSGGAPAAPVGAAPSLGPPMLPPGGLKAKLADLEHAIEKRAGRPVAIIPPPAQRPPWSRRPGPPCSD